MLITESYEKRKENDEIRMKIIHSIMEIYDTRLLSSILRIADTISSKAINYRPMTIDDLVKELDAMDCVKLLGAIKDSEGVKGGYRAYSQLYEALSGEINRYVKCAGVNDEQ